MLVRTLLIQIWVDMKVLDRSNSIDNIPAFAIEQGEDEEHAWICLKTVG